jgi:hypothetical protein
MFRDLQRHLILIVQVFVLLLLLQMKVLKLLLLVVVAYISVVVLVLELVHDKSRRKLIFGTLCVVVTVAMYASPLTVMVRGLNYAQSISYSYRILSEYAFQMELDRNCKSRNALLSKSFNRFLVQIIPELRLISHVMLCMQSMVIRTRSVEFMPFLLSLFNFINGAVWFGYAFVGQLDIFIAVSEL